MRLHTLAPESTRMNEWPGTRAAVRFVIENRLFATRTIILRIRVARLIFIAGIGAVCIGHMLIQCVNEMESKLLGHFVSQLIANIYKGKYLFTVFSLMLRFFSTLVFNLIFCQIETKKGNYWLFLIVFYNQFHQFHSNSVHFVWGIAS
jgi:hypothetical protein